MSIGLYDQDMVTYAPIPFNLEIMKLSAYYKKQREIVVLSPTFVPERHQKFFVRKDYNDGNFLSNLTDFSNVEYGGLAFSNNIYHPLPAEIEIMRPDTSVYESLEGIIKFQGRKVDDKIYQNLVTAEHCRLSLDGKHIWEDYPKQFKFLKSARNLMLHDFDLASIEGGFEEVQKILSRARTDGWATRVGMKFAPQISDGQSLLNWVSLKPNSSFYSLQYNGVIEEDAFEEFIARVKEKAIYQQLDYYITASSVNQEEFLTKYLQTVFRQVVKSRSYRVFFTLKYEEGFFLDKRWEKVIDLFNLYHNSLKDVTQSRYFSKIRTDTLFDFAKISYDNLPWYYRNSMTKQEMREIFIFVRERNPSLFEDFYTFNVNKAYK